MNNKLDTPQVIADHVNAVNERNSKAFLDTFSPTAVITDEGQQIQGVAAISDWNDVKNIGAEITLKPTNVVQRGGKTILTAEVDGSFDKTGLPDPLLMDLHFTLEADLIDTLSYHLTGE